jgi:hypothetical protein
MASEIRFLRSGEDELGENHKNNFERLKINTEKETLIESKIRLYWHILRTEDRIPIKMLN